MSLRSLRALCLTSFFIADMHDGLDPFLGIFLTQRHWQAEDIGLLMSVGDIAGLLATLPAGFITDGSRYKRLLLVGVCLVITLTALLLWSSQKTNVVALSQVANGICAVFVGPLIAGITLGLARQRGFSAQMGKNEAFNHTGNFFTALIAGAIAWYWGIGGIFILMTCTTLLTLVVLLAIRGGDIDDDAARGIEAVSTPSLPGFAILFRYTPLLIVDVTLMLFHLTNTALLSMPSTRIATAPGHLNPGLFAAATVIISQVVMTPVAIRIAGSIDRYGYWRCILLALLIMPIRAVLAASSDTPAMMVPVRILDGLVTGILGVAVPSFIVSLLRGSGHVNAGQSMVMLMQGAGAAVSPVLTGSIARYYSYTTAFGVLSITVIVALVVWWRSAPLLTVSASPPIGESGQ